VKVVEIVIAAALAAFGVASMAKWLRTDFDAASVGERLLFTLHAAARAGMWFAFAGLFVGDAVVDESQDLRWYVFVPIGLAGVQLLTGLALGMAAREGVRTARGGNGSGMASREDTPETAPGPLQEEKEGATSEPPLAQPEAAEVESARLLANEARPRLRDAGLTDEQIRRLADDYIAEDRGENLEVFVDWALANRARVAPS
jgi:hypothetical protein